ncbi:MAG TPA: FtsX-like permease family protein, partial [Longimicrobiales bacterium]|nr:FtsX-like permease family protein [Longimicrobiales bacterium]
VGADLYVPLRMDLAAQDPGSGFLSGLVRRRSDVPEARIEAALAAVADRVDEGWGEGRALRLWAAPLREDLVADVREPLLAVLAAAGFLLLALAANLATLFLARAAGREHESATRTALGAGRADLAVSVLAEIVLLTLAGAVLGVALSAQGAAFLADLAEGTLPRTAEIGLDASTVALAGAVSLVLGLLASVGPVARAVGGDPGRALRDAGVRGGDSRRRVRGRSLLVVVQVALSLVLLVGAGLLGRSLAGLLATDPGFDASGALTLRLSLDPGRYPDAPAVEAFVSDALARLEGLPGVEAAGASESLPLLTGTNQTGVRFPGAPGNTGDADADNPLADVLEVSPGFLRAGGLRLLQGRVFTRADESSGHPVVIVDDVLARRFYPTGSAVGGRVWTGGDTATIVGVVDQARWYDVHRDDRGQVYFPSWVDPDGELYLAVRAAGDPEALVPGVRRVLRDLDPNVPVSEIRTLEAVVREALREERLNLALVASFAAASLLLAALGVYGVVANAVVRRRGEIGLRMAIGARAGRVVRTVLRDGLVLVAAGLALGLPAAWAASRLLGALLFGVRPFDPWTYGAVGLLLAAVAVLAAWIPARRVTRIDPAEALRTS